VRLADGEIKSEMKARALHARLTEKAIRGFKDQIRQLTCRSRAPVNTAELTHQIHPIMHGLGEHFERAHVGGVFHELDVGSSSASGRVGSTDGAVADGENYHPPSSTVSWAL